MKRLADAVVVITGASSGIGRATAEALGAAGASVVLAARREAALHRAAAACIARGGRALAVPTDVTDAAGMAALAARAVDHFGRIDGWVNNAAVSLFARLEEGPLADFEQVIRTNLMGCVHGAWAVLPHFREQGGGTLINVSSVVAVSGQPFTSAYVASKWAIRGLSESLRMEVMDAPDIHICTLLPASIDTPLFQHAANYTGLAVQPLSPIHPPQQVACAIVGLLRRPRRELFVGAEGRLAAAAATLAPATTARVMARTVARRHLQPSPTEPTSGNLFAPMAAGSEASGGWRPPTASARRHGWITAVAAAGLLALPLAVLAARPAFGRR